MQRHLPRFIEQILTKDFLLDIIKKSIMKKAESTDQRGKETSQKTTESPASQVKALRLEEGNVVGTAHKTGKG